MYLHRQNAFTLIELLIVVAIIAILAAIAVPNFLEAQTRAKVSRVKSDLRTLSIGLTSYRVDHNQYPEGTDNPLKYPQQLADELGGLATGYYTFATRTLDGRTAGAGAFYTITTPIAYITVPLEDPFASQYGTLVYYAYRNAKKMKNGYIVTSVGPDSDLLAEDGKGTQNTNPLSTFSDTKIPSRIGDINERAVIHFMENTDQTLVNRVRQGYGSLQNALEDLSYDPTNGSISDGDIYRIGP
jgi:general secretion pathway protein G